MGDFKSENELEGAMWDHVRLGSEMVEHRSLTLLCAMSLTLPTCRLV